MPKIRHTVAVSKADALRKVFKVWYGSDGSVYVTVPYLKTTQVQLFRMRVDYRKVIPPTVEDLTCVAVDDSIDRGIADDVRVKLSHHPSGFVQFSGEGIKSGPNGMGIGVQSWPLSDPVPGPMFAVTVWGLDDYALLENASEASCIFDYDRSLPMRHSVGAVIEGYYFPRAARRFVQFLADDSLIYPYVHPARAVLNLRVLLPNEDCPLGGFVALHMYRTIDEPEQKESRYSLSSSTGNVELDAEGNLLRGDGLYCCAPPLSIPDGTRDLNYPA